MALARTLETFDPAASSRGLRRAGLALQIATRVGVRDDELAAIISAAHLNEICLLVTHDRRSDTLNPARSVLSSRVLRSAGLHECADAVHHEFERWGGSGLPTGLSGADIPVGARVLAAVGAFDEPTIAQMGWLDPELNDALDSVKATQVAPPTDLGWLDRQLEALEPPAPGTRLAVSEILEASQRAVDIIELIAEHALDQLRASSVSIARFDLDNDLLRVVVNAGALGDNDSQRPTNEIYPLSALPEALAYQAGAQRLLTRSSTASPATTRYLDLRGLSSEAVVPIIDQEHSSGAWGIVWATTFSEHSRQLGPADLTQLRSIADDLALAIQRADRFAEFENLALRDPLTGLWNRRILDESLGKIFSDPNRASPSEDAAVIICDVDELKAVNDNLGHSAGDTVLIEAGNALRDATINLPGVTVCRIGGDEFSVVIQSNGRALADRIVDDALARFRRDDPNRSMSCGIAITTPTMTKPGELMKAADEAQYERKRARKEQLGILSRSEDPSPGTRRRNRG